MITEETIVAIRRLRPNGKYYTEGDKLVWDSSNTTKKPTQAEIDSEIAIITAEAPSKAKKAELTNAFEYAMYKLTEAYSQAEQKTWATQLAQAKTHMNNNMASTPALDALCSAKGTTAGVLAPIIVAKAEALELDSLAMTGKYQVLMDQVAALNASGTATKADYDAIVW